MTEYDFIIIGAGAAGLMMADGMGKDPYFRDKRILLIDKDPKITNDRTWCYWEEGKGPFDTIVHKKWDQVYFASKDFKNSFAIAPYSYKMIKGIDFYAAYLNRIEGYPNVTFLQETVTQILEDGHNHIMIETLSGTYYARQAFNSWFTYDKVVDNPTYPILQQHFIGWFIKTTQPVFKANVATFMDFSVEQKGNTRFMYVLPFSETEAVVEYTLFSEKRLPAQEYEEAITAYMEAHYNCPDFEITETEQGSIPMTCYDFTQHDSEHLFHIGTAGGWSKPSTGYTFRNTAKKSKALLAHLKTGLPLSKFHRKNRFWYYDMLLLNILYRNNELGRPIFESLFKKRGPQQIFKFLDEETKWHEELYIMMAPNPIPFVKSLFRHIFWAITGQKKRW